MAWENLFSVASRGRSETAENLKEPALTIQAYNQGEWLFPGKQFRHVAVPNRDIMGSH